MTDAAAPKATAKTKRPVVTKSTPIGLSGAGIKATKASDWGAQAGRIAGIGPSTKFHLRIGSKRVGSGPGDAVVTRPAGEEFTFARASTKHVGPLRFGDLVRLKAADGRLLKIVKGVPKLATRKASEASVLRLVHPNKLDSKQLLAAGATIALRTKSGKYVDLAGAKLTSKRVSAELLPQWPKTMTAHRVPHDRDELLLYDSCEPAVCPAGYQFERVDWLEPWSYKPYMQPWTRNTVSVMIGDNTFATYACTKDLSPQACCARTECEGSGAGGSASLSIFRYGPHKAETMIDACDPEIFTTGVAPSPGELAWNCSLNWECECVEHPPTCQRVRKPSCPEGESVL